MAVNMRRDGSVSATVWLDEQVCADTTWPVYTGEEGGALFMLLRNPSGGGDIKIRLRKTEDAVEVPYAEDVPSELPSEQTSAEEAGAQTDETPGS